MSFIPVTALLLSPAIALPLASGVVPIVPLVPQPVLTETSKRGIPADALVAIAITEQEQLQSALSFGEWEEANRLTSSILLKSVNQYGRGYLIAKDTRQIPCKTLESVDHLWTSASSGHFGLSVQAQIWHALKGKSFEDVTKFEDRIGWLGPVDFLSTVTAPKGHLPLRPVKPAGMADAWGGWWIQEMSKRLVACKLIEDPNPPAPTPTTPAAKPGTTPGTTPKPKPASTPANPQPQPKPPVRLRDILPPVESR